jgi:hypothetical protein
MLAAPEVESTMRIQSAWLKRLCDQTSLWHALELYAKREVTFKLRTIFCVSTNQQLKFTSLDGGVARRAINVSYPFVFKHDRKGAKEKPLLDGLKNSEYLCSASCRLLVPPLEGGQSLLRLRSPWAATLASGGCGGYRDNATSGIRRSD